MKRVLLIEDQPSEREVIRRFFSTFKALDDVMELVECETLLTGIERARQGDIDIVILDLSLSDSDRQETVLHIGEFKPPVIVITGWVDEAMREDCFRHGAYYFIEKTGVIQGVINACHNAWLHRRYNPPRPCLPVA